MRRAFTLIELIITTIIIAVIVSLALPMFSDQSGGRLSAAQHRLWADIQYAQAWTIANPSTPRRSNFFLTVTQSKDRQMQEQYGSIKIVFLKHQEYL